MSARISGRLFAGKSRGKYQNFQGCQEIDKINNRAIFYAIKATLGAKGLGYTMEKLGRMNPEKL